MKTITLVGVAVAGLCLNSAFAQSTQEKSAVEKVDNIIQVQQETFKVAQQSQATVDKLSDEARDLLSEFRTVSRQIDDTRIYNAQLARQVASQEDEIRQLDQSIADVAVIRRQITPLMLKMIDTLEEFVENDLPFNRDERLDRVAQLRTYMDLGNISAAEQFRQILATYQQENNFGRTVSHYSDKIMLNGSEQDVEILRIGRVFLGYRAPAENTDVVGFWNKETGSWEPLDRSYGRIIENGLRFSKKQANPTLLILPVSAPENSQ